MNDPQHFAMAFSGPEVWPRLSATHIADRFIFQRPELTYHESLRRLLSLAAERGNERLPIDSVQVMVILKRRGKSETVRRFVHSIIQDPSEDSRAFLELLRYHLVKALPSAGNPSWRVHVRFQSELTPSMSGRNYLGNFIGRWM
jgi:hypothetical protein